MNLIGQGIQAACDSLKLFAIASEWPAIADRAVAQQRTLADFLHELLQVELGAR